MRIEIFDVGHGGCAVITGTNGKRVMLDCGYRLDPSWFPSAAFAGEIFEMLVFLNLDEDHLNDLPHVCRNVRFRALLSNPTVSADALVAMKPYGMRAGVATAHELLARLGPGRVGPLADLGPDVEAWVYYNHFGTDCADTNNLSLAFFLRYAGFTMLFAGDLETYGWRTLLRRPGFRADLATVRVLVASHHGRANGRCEEVFNWCQPDVVIFSDDARQYETQDTDDWYRARAKGIPLIDAPFDPVSGYPRRYVLTTRRDGTLTINVDPMGGYLIVPGRKRCDDLADILGEWLRQNAA